MQSLHFFLTIFLILSSILVFTSTNSVYSVLFLILAFCNSSAILLLFSAEFLGLIYIIIYVGAIAVLFLFVVMMLNTKNVKTSSSDVHLYLLTIFTFGLFGSIEAFFIFDKNFLIDSFFSISQNTSNFHLLFDDLTNIDVLGQSLYNYFLVCFLLAGFVLLVAMIGAIVLTLNFSGSRKNELVSRQLSRSDNFLSFFSKSDIIKN